MKPLSHPTKIWIVLSIIILTFFSCKKTDLRSLVLEDDLQEASASEVVNRFFTEHASGDVQEVAIINYLKKKNDQLNFVEKTVKQIGYPYWDKAISLKKKGTTLNRNSSGDSTDIFYIPFVRDGEDKVNASMILKSSASGDTSFTYACDWQYEEKEFGSVSDINSAENHAMFFMMLDFLTLGHKLFDITDTDLFSSLPLSVENKRRIGVVNTQTSIAGKAALLEYQEVCISWFTCGSPGHCGDNCDFGACVGDPVVCSGITICSGEWVETGGGGPGGPSGGPGGPSGSGGGPTGGSGLPPDCNPEVVTPGNIAGRVMGNLTCGGGGFEPVPIDDEPWPGYDCFIEVLSANIIGSLNTSAKVDSMLGTLPALNTLSEEKGYSAFQYFTINNQNVTDTTFQNSYKVSQMFDGTATGISYTVTIPPRHISACFVHTHPAGGYSAQSAKDIYTIIEDRLANAHYQGNIAAGADGNRYGVVVSNPTAAAAFLATKSAYLNDDKWKKGTEIEKAFTAAQIYFTRLYKNQPNKDNLAYEMAMAAVLKSFNTGVSLSKQQANGSYKPIAVSTFTPNTNKPNEKAYTQDCQ